MNYIFVTLVVFYCYTTKAENVKFEVLLENMTHCDQPKPPFSHKRTVIIDFNLIKSKGKYVISGQKIVLAEVPFRNFSLSGYTIDEHGKKERRWHAENISCRNFFGRIVLAFGAFQYNKANCLLKKGLAAIKDLDLDKLSHKLPLIQRGEARLLYRAHLVADGYTVFCLDVTVSNKTVK